MNTFEFKNLVKNLKNSLKQKTFFKDLRKEVETGANGTQESYVMEYTKEANPNDEVIEDKGVKVFVDSSAVMYLLGTEMDYKKEELSSTFVFNNPNETERCGCGESFKIE